MNRLKFLYFKIRKKVVSLYNRRYFSSINLEEELASTRPDYVVYVPKSLDGSTYDTGNEHFIVNRLHNKYIAIWTQSTAEGSPDQRIVESSSTDGGESWSRPRIIAGPVPPKQGGLASWAFPIITQKGRIYVFFNKHVGIHDTFFHTTGLMAVTFSEDEGKTWSTPETVPMERTQYDNPDPKYPSNWICYQNPLRIRENLVVTGFTRWLSKEVRHPPPFNSWTAHESVVEFMRFTNIDDHPSPSEIKIEYTTMNEKALRAPLKGYEHVSVIQEPSIVQLPDKRLFCAMRTTQGCPYYSLSSDEGLNWSAPRPLKFSDSVDVMKHPLSPCPIYQINDREYFILIHNHDGHYQNYGPLDTQKHRRPIYLCKGKFKKSDKQPITFSQPEFLMDHTGVGLGLSRRHDLAMYSSFTNAKNTPILWYPDRKFFLLGKLLHFNAEQ